MGNWTGKLKSCHFDHCPPGAAALMPRGAFILAGEQPTEAQIFEALKPVKTRGFGGDAKTGDHAEY